MGNVALYVAGDCIAEYGNFETAQRDFYKEVREHPDCPIDIMAEDGETSLLAYDEETEQVYN